MISTMKTRPCELAVVWIWSIAVVAMSTADWKPKVMSVPHRSLSMVFGSVMTFRPSSDRRFAVFVDPLPPSMTRQSSCSL